MPESNQPSSKKQHIEAYLQKIDRGEKVGNLRFDQGPAAWKRTNPTDVVQRRSPDQRPLATDHRESPKTDGPIAQLKANGRPLPPAPRPQPSNHIAQLKASGVNLPEPPKPPVQGHGNDQQPGKLAQTNTRYDLKAVTALVQQNHAAERQLKAIKENLQKSPLMASRGYDNAKHPLGREKR